MSVSGRAILSRIGLMDRRITIQKLTTAQDAAGQETKTWTDLKHVWARVEPLRGSEFWAARQVVADEVLRFTIWYRSDVGPTNRIVYDGRNYDIEQVAEVGRRRQLKITAKARAE